MEKSHRTLMLVVLALLAFGGVISAQDRSRDGQVRGTFVALAERWVGDGEYLGIVVRPFERQENVTVLVPREYEELRQSARMMQPGDRLEISYVREHGEMWIESIEVERRRVEGDGGAEGGERIEIRRQALRGPERIEERREGERRVEVRRQMRREPQRGRADERREGEKRIVMHWDGRREPDGPFEQGRRPGPPMREQLERLVREVVSEHMQRLRPEPSALEELGMQLREVFTRHTEQLGMELKEILTFHVERVQVEIHELRTHAENLRREVEELRRENEMLRRQLPAQRRPGTTAARHAQRP
ncbi:MAG: hypothetical protein ACYTBS_10105 [Planctomycetota bacterium]